MTYRVEKKNRQARAKARQMERQNARRNKRATAEFFGGLF